MKTNKKEVIDGFSLDSLINNIVGGHDDVEQNNTEKESVNPHLKRSLQLRKKPSGDTTKAVKVVKEKSTTSKKKDMDIKTEKKEIVEENAVIDDVLDKKPSKRKPSITKNASVKKLKPGDVSSDIVESDTVDNLEDDLKMYGLSSMSSNIFESVVVIPSNEIRFLVDSYYQTQEYRKATENQIRSIAQGYDGDDINEVPSVLKWLSANVYNQEKQIKKALEYWVSDKPVAKWAMDIVGVGPIITAGLLSYFDITNKKYAGQFWSYSGLNNNNNPWLGKDGSKKKLVEFDGIIDNLNTSRISSFPLNINGDTSYSTALKKIVKHTPRQTLIRIITDIDNIQDSMNGDDDISNAVNSFGASNMMKLRGDISKFNSAIEMLYIIDFVYDTQYLNDEHIEVIAKLTNRSISTITKGVTDENGEWTRKKLESYLPITPYSRELKTLCWKLGDSFVKRSNHPDSLYGALYKERKAYEIRNNDAGLYSEQARLQLSLKNYSKGTEARKAYDAGKLPDGHIDARARRWVVKLFISHLFEAMYLDHNHEPAPKPYILAYDENHHDYISPEVPFSKYIK